MFTIWYFLWNVIFFVYNFLFSFIVKFVFNKSNVESVNDSVLLKFLYTLNYNMSPVCFLVQDRRVVGDANLFVSNRAGTYPFIHEVTNVFDINTAKNADITQISFKNLYNEFNFYTKNSQYFSNFFKKNLLNTSEDLLNHLVFTNIVYNNFFLNLKNTNGFFEKAIYSTYLNFVLFYSYNKLSASINKVFYINPNFFGDTSFISLGASSNLSVKNLDVFSSTSLSATSSKVYSSSLSVYEKYSSYFVKSNSLLLNVFKDWSLNLDNSFSEKINSLWSIKFSGSDITKYINGSTLNNFVIYYLRKSKVFNKGRYSRNRQTYRTGVYWSLYVNIIAMIGLTYWFYRFTINFGYVWWFLYIFIASFFIPKAIKYRFYNPCELFNSIISDILWLGFQFNILTTYLISKLSWLVALFKKLV